MTEKLLQFIWQNRYYNEKELKLDSGERLIVDGPGEKNNCQGPDFINARIRINDCCWAGSIELHIFSSGWIKHSHEEDSNYRNVILHVVWKKDIAELKRNIPQLELCHRISQLMLETYSGWMKRSAFIPCEISASKTGHNKWENWASRLLVNRLNRKMFRILHSLQANQYHWEEQLRWMIAANFGYPVNGETFTLIARSIPFTIITRHRENIFQLEALFTGQANLLGKNYHDDYPLALKKEYTYLNKKYRLKKIYEPVHFLRMRPQNFPGIRLSQLAAFAGANSSFFSWLLDIDSLSDVRKKLALSANEYWNTHYIFDRCSPLSEKILGPEMRNNIIINSIIPLLYTYGKTVPDSRILKKTLNWLDQIPAEENNILQKWKAIGVSVKKASGSQALLELKTEYCDLRRCLECEIGQQLLKPG